MTEATQNEAPLSRCVVRCAKSRGAKAPQNEAGTAVMFSICLPIQVRNRAQSHTLDLQAACCKLNEHEAIVYKKKVGIDTAPCMLAQGLQVAVG